MKVFLTCFAAAVASATGLQMDNMARQLQHARNLMPPIMPMHTQQLKDPCNPGAAGARKLMPSYDSKAMEKAATVASESYKAWVRKQQPWQQKVVCLQDKLIPAIGVPLLFFCVCVVCIVLCRCLYTNDRGREPVVNKKAAGADAANEALAIAGGVVANADEENQPQGEPFVDREPEVYVVALDPESDGSTKSSSKSHDDGGSGAVRLVEVAADVMGRAALGAGFRVTSPVSGVVVDVRDRN